MAFSRLALGDGEAIAQLEGLKVAGGDARHHRELDGRTIVAAGVRAGRGRRECRTVLAPEIQFVARVMKGLKSLPVRQSPRR